MMALVPVLGFSQFDMGGGQTTSSGKPWDKLKLNAKTRVKLDFRNSSVDNIIQLYQKVSGVTIVKDPALTGALTITSASPVGLKDAFQILSTTLTLKGYDMSREGSLLVIKKKPDPNAGGGGRGTGMPGIPGMPGGMPQGMDFGAMFGGGGNAAKTELKVYPITFAAASQVAKMLNEVFADDGGGNTNPFAAAFGGGRGGFRMPGQGGNSSGPKVKASSDDFSNSVLVNAPSEQQKQVADLIKQVDRQTEQPQRSTVYKLTYAAASDLVTTVQNVLTSNAPKGRGNTGQQQGGGFFQQLFGGNRNGAQSQVSADNRSNSVIVTATEEVQGVVGKVIKELDVPISDAGSTFVIPLANAKADDVATLLNSAFGQRQGANRTGTGGTARTGTNGTNRNNAGARPGGATLGGNNGLADPDSDGTVQMNFRDPNADSGELMTSVGVTQGFGFFGGGGQNQNQNRNNQTPARDAQGRIVNSRDLTGQVTTIADPNTNSIIVVTTPENAELIRTVVEQLDKIPVQVMIETVIVEASLDAESQFGFEWKFNQLVKGVTTTGQSDFSIKNNTTNPPTGLKFSMTGGTIEGYLNAMQSDTKFNVLSTPRIFTSNNQQAEINISQSVPYVLSSREDANGNLSYQYDFKDVGIVLTVTPRITSNGYVSMEVSQTANDLQGFTSFNAPIINQRQAQTTVSVKDGDTIVLGGIIRNTVSSTVKKIPLLGDIPLLGNLFKSTSKTNNKTELLLFMRPRVVRDADDAAMLKQQQIRDLSKASQKTLEKVVPPTGGAAGNGGGN